MATLKVRIKGGQVSHQASGFPGQDCQEVGEAYLRRFGLDSMDAHEEPTETDTHTEAHEG